MTVSKIIVNSVERRRQYEKGNTNTRSKPIPRRRRLTEDYTYNRKTWKCRIGCHDYTYYLSPGPNPVVKVIAQCKRCRHCRKKVSGHTVYSWLHATWMRVHYLAWFRATCTTCEKRFWRHFPPNKFEEHCCRYCSDDDAY